MAISFKQLLDLLSSLRLHHLRVARILEFLAEGLEEPLAKAVFEVIAANRKSSAKALSSIIREISREYGLVPEPKPAEYGGYITLAEASVYGEVIARLERPQHKVPLNTLLLYTKTSLVTFALLHLSAELEALHEYYDALDILALPLLKRLKFYSMYDLEMVEDVVRALEEA